MTENVVIYARVSTPDQNVDGQVQNLEDFARIHGYTVVRVFKDVRSGKNPDRPDYNAMMTYLRSPANRQNTKVLVVRLDRLMRSVIHMSELASQLSKWNVSIVTTDQGEFDFGSSVGQLHLNLLSSIAQYERDLISDRTKEGLRHCRGRVGREPCGISRNEVIKMHDNGMTYKEIADHFKVSKQTIWKITVGKAGVE